MEELPKIITSISEENEKELSDFCKKHESLIHISEIEESVDGIFKVIFYYHSTMYIAKTKEIGWKTRCTIEDLKGHICYYQTYPSLNLHVLLLTIEEYILDETH